VTFAGAGSVEIYAPLNAGDVLNVRKLTLSTDAAAELVAFFGEIDGDRLTEQRAIDGLFLAANGGAAPDPSCLGDWSPAAGLAIRLWASAACNAWISVAGYVET
jgi:hypothetical protein